MPESGLSSAGLASSGVGRLRSMQSARWGTSLAIGIESPEKVSSNAIDILKAAGPSIGALTALIVPWAMLITAVYRHEWLRKSCSGLKSYFCSFIYASIAIPGDHELYSLLLRWTLDEGLQSKVRTVAISDRARDKRRSANADHDVEGLKEELNYIPDIGNYAFFYKGYRMSIERRAAPAPTREGRNGYKPPGLIRQEEREGENMVLSCLSPWTGLKPIQDFLECIKAEADALRVDMTSVFRADVQGYWRHTVSRKARTLEAVTLESGVKEGLVQDVETYLHVNTRKYYANRGIPWRRGYLFYGPPGTGKTSFTTALAGHFKLNVYMLSLSSQILNDSSLENLFDHLPRKCIVLLEDIDSAGIRREEMRRKQRLASPKPKRQPNGEIIKEEPLGITLSGLLNVLDGVHAAEGRIVIMTSNKPETLDEALVRRGRIDRKIPFDCASKAVAAKLFTHVYCKTAEEMLDGELVREETFIGGLAPQFAAQFPEHTYTPAEIQGFLIDHRADPVKAVMEAFEHSESLAVAKAKGLNVLSVEADKVQAEADAAAEESLDAGVTPAVTESSDDLVEAVASDGEGQSQEDVPPDVFDTPSTAGSDDEL